MNILVTGGAGYIGSVLVPTLLNAGHKVTVIDNFMFSQISLLDCCINKDLTLIKGDTRDKSLMAEHIKTADAIVPLACLTGAPLCDKEPKEAEEIIFDAIKMITKLRSSNQMIVYPTTNSGYGVGEQGKHCTEETPLRPISLYGRLKVKAEEEVLNAGYGVTLRLATAFGVSPRMRLDLLVNDFTYRAFFDHYIELFEAHFMRNFIHVRDISNAFLHILNHFDKVKEESYNVGLSDANLSKLQLCEEIKKHIPDFKFVESKCGEDPDKRDYIVSNEKIEQTGFQPQVSLSDGIQELIKGYIVLDHRKSVTTQFSNI